jgi:hypothetical protein
VDEVVADVMPLRTTYSELSSRDSAGALLSAAFTTVASPDTADAEMLVAVPSVAMRTMPPPARPAGFVPPTL